MLKGKSGTLFAKSDSWNRGHAEIKVFWEEWYDLLRNVSVIKITKIQITHSTYDGTFYLNLTVAINGRVAAQLSGNQWTGIVPSTGSWGDVTGGSLPLTSFEIPHDDSTGLKSINLDLTIDDCFNNEAGWQGSSGGKDSTTIELTPIPRLSEISAPNGTLGQPLTIKVMPKSSAYTHTVTYQCGSASGQISGKTSRTAITWTPPLSLAAQATSGNSVMMDLIATTYNGSTAIGSKKTVITCAIPDEAAPTVSLSVTDAEGYSAKYGAYVQGWSKAKVVTTAQPKHGASISRIAVEVNNEILSGQTVISDVLRTPGTSPVTATVMDSRGKTGTASQTIQVLEYIAPTISSLGIRRTNENGEPNDQGSYVQANFKANVSTLNNRNSVAYRLEWKKSAEAQYQTGVDLIQYAGQYAVTGSHIFAADTGSTYDVRLIVRDDFAQSVRSTVVSTAFTTWHVKENGKGWAFGKVSEYDNLLDVLWNAWIHGNLRVDGDITSAGTASFGGIKIGGKTLLDATHPVGEVYVSTDPTSPHDLFGGNWLQLQDVFLYAASDSYPAGSTGGTTTHSHALDAMATISIRGRNKLSMRHYTQGTEWTADHTAPVSAPKEATDTQPFYDGANVIGTAKTATVMPPYLAVHMWQRLEDDYVPPEQYTITVDGGTATPAKATAGQRITIQANPPQSGYVFDYWSTDTAVNIDNINADSTSFVMVNQDVTVTANYKKADTPPPARKYRLTINGGTASGYNLSGGVYLVNPGAKVTINATVPGDREFNYWTASPYIAFGNDYAAQTTITMPAFDVTVTANFKAQPNPPDPVKYSVNVSGGSANPMLTTQGTTITITAQAPRGQKFSYWTADVSINFGNQYAATTTFPMPGRDVNITAHFVADGGGGGGSDLTQALGDFLNSKIPGCASYSGGILTIDVKNYDFYNVPPLWKEGQFSAGTQYTLSFDIKIKDYMSACVGLGFRYTSNSEWTDQDALSYPTSTSWQHFEVKSKTGVKAIMAATKEAAYAAGSIKNVRLTPSV